jgi:SAM-dependent methyltransferase
MLRTFSPPHLPFKESSFDIVIGFQSIHLNSAAVAMRKMIAEVHRVLKPGGYFFFTVLDDDHYIMIHDYARFVGKNTIEIRRNFPEKERHGMRYFFFRTEGEVKEYFSDFSTVRIGKSLLELDDGKVSSWRIIFGQK